MIFLLKDNHLINYLIVTKPILNIFFYFISQFKKILKGVYCFLISLQNKQKSKVFCTKHKRKLQ